MGPSLHSTSTQTYIVLWKAKTNEIAFVETEAPLKIDFKKVLFFFSDIGTCELDLRNFHNCPTNACLSHEPSLMALAPTSLL